MHPNLCVWRAVNQLTVYYWGSIVAMAQLWEPLWHVSHNLTYDRDKAKGWILLHTGRRKENTLLYHVSAVGCKQSQKMCQIWTYWEKPL